MHRTLVAGLALAFTIAAPAQALRYELRLLPPQNLVESREVSVRAVNADGVSVGNASLPGNYPGDAHVWAVDGSSRVVPVTSFTSLTLQAINDAGLVGVTRYGQRIGAGGRRIVDDHAALLRPTGEVQVIAPEWLKLNSTVTAINRHGVVAGYAYPGPPLDLGTVGFVWSAEGGWRTIEEPDGTSRLILIDINDDGTLLGRTLAFPARSFFVTPDGKHRLLPKDGSLNPSALNNRGQIVGTAQRGAFLYEIARRKLNFLPAPPGWRDCWAGDIDDAGLAVGGCTEDVSGERFGVLWEPVADGHRPHRMADLVDAPQDFPPILGANAIGSTGIIAVSVAELGYFRAAILIPKDTD